MTAAEAEFDADVIISQVESLKDIVNLVDAVFLSPENLNELSEKVVKLLMDSDKRKAQNEDIAKEEEIDEDE